jgi:alpha-ribazole phosphatase
MEIYLIRHPTPDIEKGVCYGFSDIHLIENWETEGAIIGEKLPKKIDAVFCSPLQRCQLLADFLFKKHEIQFDNRLKELHFGDWEMQKWSEIDADALNNWMMNYVHVACPNGESYAELAIRANNFLTELSKKNYKCVVIISHGGWIRAALAHLRDKTLEEMIAEKVIYGEVILTHLPIDYLKNRLE